jgi:hypothetical protein
MTHAPKPTPRSWLAFDLNVLRRLDFRSIAIPFVTDPALGVYLKRWGARVLANDPLQSAYTTAVATIQNNSERLTDEHISLILEDVYIPGNKLSNRSLTRWFSETDAWWFDNVRQNLVKLDSPYAAATGAVLAMATGDYALSFADDTRDLRQPLSTVFRRLRSVLGDPVNNGQNNTCQNKTADDFIAEANVDLMFLRLPPPGNPASRRRDLTAWKEEWFRGGDEFWSDLDAAQNGRLGMPVETKSQYMQLLEETLRRASNTRLWAIAHVESGFLSSKEIADLIGKIRPVDSIYTKDFSELTGTKAVIITA